MKVLNIDAFAAPKRQILFGGKSYLVNDINLQSFIDNITTALALEGTGSETDPAKQLEMSITVIMKSIPDLPEAEIRMLNINQMGMVMEFIRGDIDDKADEVLDEKKAM